jgi:putative PIG3 family NAD(P)H quinone oxidoreductase
LNRADLLQRQGKYPAPAAWPADIPGLEFAGEITACGERVARWRKGQRVFGLVGGGAHAEFVAIHERAVAAVPEQLSWAQAAAIPEVFITAHDALWVQAQLRTSERVLIHAVGSGVGLSAVQLARAIGAAPFGISRTAEKIERAREYGLEAGAVINDPLTELPECARKLTGGRGFDVVLDLAGGPYVRAAIEALAPKGRLMLVGTVAGARSEIPISSVMAKRLTIRGTVMRARQLEERIATIQRFAAEVLPLFSNGSLRPTIDSGFPLEQVRSAHERLESNETFGKVVLTLA